MLNAKDKRRLRQIAHRLSPVVTIADNGASPAVVEETARALADHEIIKVKINVDDRAERKSIGTSLAEQCNADVVHTVGKVWVLFKPNPQAEPKLSNLTRFGAQPGGASRAGPES